MGDDVNRPPEPAADTEHDTGQGAATPELLTVNEIAGLLRLSKMTIYRLIEGGELPALRIGRSYRVHRDALTAFMAKASEGE
jgi:excisionase family DNA binding protein